MKHATIRPLLMKFTTEGQPTKPGIRRVNLRAEIKSSPLFGSVKEVVIRFGGTAPLLPRYKKKDLMVKELETLDALDGRTGNDNKDCGRIEAIAAEGSIEMSNAWHTDKQFSISIHPAI
ncbi:hypothetical protein SLEP1_g11295 [Rubroshorea leprosula]|uniref:Uncharacterized protein n=1 Tax=Rubroshorea leprosula TaxID=152421 RepID=A0AAV5IAW1_9ROSI|nr:hypothetical protein SLEP1_g11295 [Rubroshorea leprosula]